MTYDEHSTRVLSWDKPARVQSHAAHVEQYQADGAPPGTYVPNMSAEDQQKWRGKYIGGATPRVEVRKRFGPSLFLMVVTRQGTVLSMNGRCALSPIDWQELMAAHDEAQATLDERAIVNDLQDM